MILNQIKKSELTKFFPIFDFDNTIINELDYIFPIFIQTLNSTQFDQQSKKELEICYINHFKKFRSKGIIDALNLEDHQKEIFLDEYIEGLRKSRKFSQMMICDKSFKKFVTSEYFIPDTITIISNGNPLQQKNKFNNTNFEGIEKKIELICANEYKAKPSPNSFNENFFEKNKYLYIGDSSIDMKFAQNAEIDFLNIATLRKIF
tara:strand:- start:1514 stop:2128 length:615 start_codon:yes stop_codon:yes gene_type:complete